MQIDEVLARIPHIDALRAAREAAQVSAWIVGGAVRDVLLGQTPADVDITTREPALLGRRFAERVGGHVVPMDPERDIWRVAFSGDYFDFCGFRDHDILGDLAGRDFTINAIALRLPDDDLPGSLLDPLHGVDDLEQRRLRMVNPSVFRADPARILRAFRFLSELHVSIEAETWQALRQDADRLPLVAVERLLAEWWRLCAGAHVAEAMQRMDSAGVLGILFPEIEATKAVGQNAFHRYNVWEHLLMTATCLARFLRAPEEVFQDLLPEFVPIINDPHRRARLVCTALLHDIGKPETRSEEEGRVHFYQHEVAGAQLAAEICRRLRMSKDDTRAIVTIIHNHLRPLFLLLSCRTHALSRKAMLKFFDACGEFAFDVLALAMADKEAGQGPAADADVQERLRDLTRTLATFYHAVYLPALAHPVLTGRDLTQQLRLPPGPEIGDILSRARHLQILGQLNSRAEALSWAGKMVKDEQGEE